MRVLWIVLLLLSTRAYAQRAEADAAFERGRTLMKRGDYAAACEAFEASLQLERAIGTLYNLGLCHEKLGKLATAYTELKQVAATDTNRGRADDAARRADALEARLVRMKLVVDEPAPGLVVERDGLDVTALAGQVVPVDPRRYTFTATAPGRTTFTQQVALDREGATVEVRIPALGADADAPAPITPDGYPSELARRPLTLPDGRYELGVATVLSTSDAMFEQTPVHAGVDARIAIQMFELGVRATFHARYPEDESTRPKPWRSVSGLLAYAISPVFAGRLEYTRYHPVGEVGAGSDLRLTALRKHLVTPRIALVGAGGFVYADREGGRNELTVEAGFGAQATATQRLAFEGVAELGINAGGDLYSHTIGLGIGVLALYALDREIDVYARVFLGLLPAVEGGSSSDFRTYTAGVSWRP